MIYLLFTLAFLLARTRGATGGRRKLTGSNLLSTMSRHLKKVDDKSGAVGHSMRRRLAWRADGTWVAGDGAQYGLNEPADKAAYYQTVPAPTALGLLPQFGIESKPDRIGPTKTIEAVRLTVLQKTQRPGDGQDRGEMTDIGRQMNLDSRGSEVRYDPQSRSYDSVRTQAVKTAESLAAKYGYSDAAKRAAEAVPEGEAGKIAALAKMQEEYDQHRIPKADEDLGIGAAKYQTFEGIRNDDIQLSPEEAQSVGEEIGQALTEKDQLSIHARLAVWGRWDPAFMAALEQERTGLKAKGKLYLDDEEITAAVKIADAACGIVGINRRR